MRSLDANLAHYYALALVAIARAEGRIGRDDGLRLQQRIEARAGRTVPLDDLLLAEPLEPGHFAALLASPTGPFRGGVVHPRDLAEMIVVDAIAVVLAGKGHVTEGEAREMLRFAQALGASADEVRAMGPQLAPWIAPRRT